MNWEKLNWEALDRLRGNFLSGSVADGPYWQTPADLESYHATFGERIGWKWDAVLRVLRQQGWTPSGTGGSPPDVLDWGCGSGVASRRVIDCFGVDHFARLRVHDYSPLAVDFAVRHGGRAYPGFPVEAASRDFISGDEPIGLLVVSHVMNELDALSRAELARLCARALQILWVEPGSHEVSRALGAWRERLRQTGLELIAPCPHQAPCGMLAAGNERH